MKTPIAPPVAESPRQARLVVHYPRTLGTVSLRGEKPLDWDVDLLPVEHDATRAVFVVPVEMGEAVDAKLMRSDGTWATGRNLVLAAGDDFEIRPSFDRRTGALEPWMHLNGASPLRFRVLLPPSYAEQPGARYPVVYAQDGQSLWSDGEDPFGVWQLDQILDELWSLGCVAELIVVSIDTGTTRFDHLGPVPDAKLGGGRGAEYLERLVTELKPHIDRVYRTLPAPATTACLGSSMGGLFAFFAAWTRPDVFGNAICLSSAFWWADRWAVKLARGGVCPAPRPVVYLDSGASRAEFENDENARDGQHHTRAVERALIAHCYEPGDDLHVLAFPGQGHDARAWAGRVAIPLQLVFPRRDG